MKIVSCIIIFTLLAFTNCSKNNALPPATQTGQNIVACTVNGSIHIYKGKGTFLSPSGVGYFMSRNQLFFAISATDVSKYNDGFIFNIDDLLPVPQVNYFIKNDNNPSLYNDYSYANPEILIDPNISTVTFTRYDSLVAAGTFDATTLKDSVHIQTYRLKGYFDISLK